MLRLLQDSCVEPSSTMSLVERWWAHGVKDKDSDDCDNSEDEIAQLML